MPGFGLRQILNIVSFQMLAPALVYPVRNAIRVARSTTDRRGVGYIKALMGLRRGGGRPRLSEFESSGCMGAVRGVACEDERTVRLRMEQGSVRVRALAGDLLQIRYCSDDHFELPFSYSVEKPEDLWPPEQLTAEESQTRVEIRSSGLQLVLEKATGHLTLSDGDGQVLFTQGQAFTGEVDPSPIAWRASFLKETPFYGLGEKASGLNHAGRRFELWNADPSGYGRGRDPIYMSVPLVMAVTKGQAVGLFFDNSHRAWVDLGSRTRGQLRYAATGGELRLYVMAGTPARVLERFTELVGRTKLPPLWAFGLHQSRWSYYSQERVLEIAREFRRQQARASVAGLGRLRPDRRPLVLTRSGWAGVQRYAIHWTGDNQSTWDHLALTLPMVMNLGISGVPITGPDTGGFTGGPSPELYARWMEVGAFTPFFRIHSMAGSPNQEPWAFGEEVERISRRYWTGCRSSSGEARWSLSGPYSSTWASEPSTSWNSRSIGRRVSTRACSTKTMGSDRKGRVQLRDASRASP